jgi:hypothetical protein
MQLKKPSATIDTVNTMYIVVLRLGAETGETGLKI